MAKLILPTLESGFLSVDAMNDGFRLIEAWTEGVLSRLGDSPNQMEADLDLNGYTLLNLGASDSTSSIITYNTMVDYVNSKSSGLIKQEIETFTATAAQTVFVLTQFSYEPNVGNLAVYKNGVRLFSPANYTETSPTTITLVSGAALNDKIQVVSSEFLATVSLPPHTHPWSQVIGPPVQTTRWPVWTEVTEKPTSFNPSAHSHATTDITSGNSFGDNFRGIFVQSAQPTATRTGDLWFWG